MPTTILRDNPRFLIASRTRNARFPASESQRAGRVEYCTDAEDVARTLQRVIDDGLRPTVRSSGHCYEDFIVNNPGGAILDLSALNRVSTGPAGAAPYRLETGTMLGQAYEQLYKLAGRTIPGGTCYTVTAGGHISGGGYGTLVRLYGLTVDWVTAIDIVTVNHKGKAVARRVDARHEPHLFRALRGGQASSFGIITAFHFDALPPVPQEVVHAGLSWDWKGMTEERFTRILTTYGEWMVANDRKQETWGLFSGLSLTNKESGRIELRAEFTVPEGPVKDLSVIYDLLDRFGACKPDAARPGSARPVVDGQENRRGKQAPSAGDSVCYGDRPVDRKAWLESTVSNQEVSTTIAADNHRAKYKSCYMKKNFTEAEAQACFRMFTGDATRGLLLVVDSYGGAANDPARANDTAIPQRSSVMKLQYQSYWQDPAEDAYRLKGIRDTYTAVYSTDSVSAAHQGTPYPGDQYDGCYINYPDADMLEHAFWPQLYYGEGDLYPLLQRVKREFDPHNIFHHAMSVRV